MRKLLVITVLALAVVPLQAAEPPAGTIAYSSLAPRGWDLYVTDVQASQTRRLTDHPALDYNAAFAPDGQRIAFVSERDGNLELYVIERDGSGLKRLTDDFALDDHPAWSPDGKRIAFVSTRQPAEKPGQAWNAVYVMNADGSGVQRVSGTKAADYSPAWSPKGDLIAVASGSGRAGGTDLYVMKSDGSNRKLVVKDGGWPAFAADGSALYFHSKRQGKWGVWRVNLDSTGLERVTPADVEAYTPRTAGKWLVAAVGRRGRRQIELTDTASGKTTAVTEDATDHWNPSVSPDGRYVVYHKATPGSPVPNVELWGTPPETRLRLLRLAGAFPAFAPDGKRLALTGGSFGSIDVMKVDGSDRKTIYKGEFRGLFSISWAHEGDRIAFSLGGVFQGAKGKVDLVALRPDGSDVKPLTEDKGNNGFPSYSPDGKQLVFRSGRDGSKNLYVMNADGTGVRRLTEGKWTDTMADWSPAGEWIAFASDRDGDFEVWLVKPDGSGLRKLVAGGGRNNHPHFSPDGKWVVFTSQRAGWSAEEISLPHQPQPYGDLFVVRVDGTGLLRLTHNGFEEGTPAWGPVLDVKPSGEGRKPGGTDY
jgi:Tol biopolymer transport system component